MPYSQKNNPVKMMKSALEMHKAEKKAGMHRDSAMYMNHSPMEMGHSPMEMGHDSPAKNASKYGIQGVDELKYMPIVDDMHRKGDSPAKMKKDSPMEKELVGKQKNLPEHLKKAIEAAPESPAKMGHKDSPAKKYDRVVFGGNKGDKSKTKPGKKDFEGKGSPAKKYDRVVLGGNKGDKSKTKPGKKDYMGKKK